MARIELFFILRIHHWGASGRCQGFLRLLLDTPRNFCLRFVQNTVGLSWQESLCGPVVIGGSPCLCFYVTLNVWLCESPLSTVCVCVCSVMSDSATPWTVASHSPSVHGILQARILDWVAFPYPRDLSDPGIELASLTPPALAWEAP